MSKTKIVMIFFIIGFSLAFIKPIYQRLSFASSNVPDSKIELIFKNNTAQINKTFTLKQRQCYEIGLYSKVDTFRGSLMESPFLQGNYTLVYSNKNNTVRTKNGLINKDAKTTGFTGVGGRTKHSTLMLDLLSAEYNNTMNINLELANLDRQILNDEIYFYIRPTYLLCGKKKELQDSKEIKNPETNETLMPLYVFLQDRNITNLIDFFNTTKLPYNVTMTGNRTALHYAVYFNNANAASYLLSYDKSIIDKRDIIGRTALSYGIEYVHVDVVKELLKYKPNFEIVELQKRPPYNKANYYGEKGIMQFLFDQKTYDWWDLANKYRGLIDQTQHDVEGMMEALLDAGLNPNTIRDIEQAAENPYYGTFLDYAFSKQGLREDEIRYMKQYEEKNKTDDRNYKNYRLQQDYTKIIQLLKDHGGKTFAELNNQSNITTQGE
jgi:hypothetical protein